MLHKTILFIFSFLISTVCLSQKINRYKNNERHGKWVVYSDSTETQIDNIGRYKKGIPKGVWKFYNEQGVLTKKEKYRFKKIHTTYYHPNGKIQKKGKAKIVLEEKYLHFYYYGNWLVYDSTGVLIKKQVYENGTKISEVCYKTDVGKTINDSLVTVLKIIDQEFYKYFDSVNIAEKTFGKNSQQYQRAKSLNALNTSKFLNELDKLISTYGYPGKTLTGEKYYVAFSAISYANIEYKEKYYDLIIDAANKEELDWSDVAFFVDKVKVAKKEKQIYCTQFRYDEKLKQLLYYPTLDIEKLNQRRKEVGLTEMDISTLNFIAY